MGLFNWVNKGIKVERREVAVEDTQPVQQLHIQELKPQVEVQQATEHVASPQSIAQAVLFQQQSTAQTMQPSFAASSLFDKSYDAIATNQYLNNQGQFSSALAGPTLGNRNILVIAPCTEKDVTLIVDNLNHGEACIVNFETMPVTEAQRRLDFLSGVVCAICGTIKPLDGNKYILTPSSMGIRI